MNTLFSSCDILLWGNGLMLWWLHHKLCSVFDAMIALPFFYTWRMRQWSWALNSIFVISLYMFHDSWGDGQLVVPFLASLLIYSKYGDTSESDDFLLSVLSWFPFVFHSHLLMIIAYDVNKHIIALSELLFTAWEVIDIFLFILALWSLSMIVGCDDRLYIVSSERMHYSQWLRS